MRIILTLILMLFYTAQAGIVVSYDGEGEVTSIRRGSPTAGALYYNDDSVNWIEKKALMQAEPRKYLKVAEGEVVKKSQAVIDAYEAAIVQAQLDAEIARAELLQVSAYELGRALVQLGVVNGPDLKAQIKENLGVD